MTLFGFIIRLVIVLFITLLFVGINEPIGWALCFGLIPIAIYEMLRSC